MEHEWGLEEHDQEHQQELAQNEALDREQELEKKQDQEYEHAEQNQEQQQELYGLLTLGNQKQVFASCRNRCKGLGASDREGRLNSLHAEPIGGSGPEGSCARLPRGGPDLSRAHGAPRPCSRRGAQPQG